MPTRELNTQASTIDRRLWWDAGPRPSAAIRLVRSLVNIVEGSFTDRMWVRAGYMTYLSLFHLVPLGALALALAGQLGWRENLVEWITIRLSPTAPDLAANLVAAMQRLDLYTVGVIGLGAVLIASMFAIIELEEYLSSIWHAPGFRDWWKRLVFYPLAIVLGPAVLAVILALSTIAEGSTTQWITLLSRWGSFSEWLYQLLLNVPVLFRLVPYLITWLGLTLFYYVITSAPVRFQSAAVGGITAGVIWQLAQQAYISFQFGVSTYREIWGYLAQIPLLILWVYLSWIIFYLGAEVVFAWQYRKAFLPKWPGLLSRSVALEEDVVTKLHTAINTSRKPECGTPELSTQLQIPWPLVEFVARRMTASGLLTQRRTAAGFCYASAPSMKSMSPNDVLGIYRQLRELPKTTEAEPELPPADTDDDDPDKDT
ncbi:MAG: YihY family inner membrane protein [candidate division Zixibacteria bacterium]|nr:YihY family inner membrane protein [candidate division Zixibacteria bacterium]